MNIKKRILDYFHLYIWLGIWKDDPNNPILILLKNIKDQQTLNERFFDEHQLKTNR